MGAADHCATNDNATSRRLSTAAGLAYKPISGSALHQYAGLGVPTSAAPYHTRPGRAAPSQRPCFTPPPFLRRALPAPGEDGDGDAYAWLHGSAPDTTDAPCANRMDCAQRYAARDVTSPLGGTGL